MVPDLILFKIYWYLWHHLIIEVNTEYHDRIFKTFKDGSFILKFPLKRSLLNLYDEYKYVKINWRSMIVSDLQHFINTFTKPYHPVMLYPPFYIMYGQAYLPVKYFYSIQSM